MKKSAVIILLLAFTLLINGCSDTNKKAKTATDEEYNYITDSQIVQSNNSTYAYNITKSENGYYLYARKYIYYVESESMQTIPLCFKPNCLHNSTDCNAYLGAIYSIVYNDGYIYYSKDGDVNDEYLGTQFFRMSTDGTEKVKLVYFDSIVNVWTIHRGYLYYVSTTYDVDLNGDSVTMSNSNAYIYRINLKSVDVKPEQIYYDESLKFNSSISGVIGFGDNLYFLSTGQTDTGYESYVMKSLKLNLSDFSIKEMKNQAGKILVFPNLLGDKLIFQCEKNEDGRIEYYSADFNGNAVEHILTVDEFERAFADGKYLYVDNRLEFTIANSDYNETEKVRRFKVYDENINLIDEVYFNGENACSWSFLPVDDKVFLFAGIAADDSVVVFSYNKSQLGSINGEWEESVHYNTSVSIDNMNAPGALSEAAPHGSDALVELWQKAKDKKYGVKDSFQADEAVVEGGFSVRLIWEQDGGTTTAYFPIMEFENEEKATEFVKDNPYTLQKGSIVVNVGVESIPQEVYDMLSSILEGSPIDPISDKEFSLEMYEFAH